MDNREKRLIESFTTVGGVLLLFGAAVYITGWSYAPYLYFAGSLLFACGQFADRYNGDNRIIKRLRFQQVLGACFLLFTTVLLLRTCPNGLLVHEMGWLFVPNTQSQLISVFNS